MKQRVATNFFGNNDTNAERITQTIERQDVRWNSVSFKKCMTAALSVTKTNPYFEGSKAATNGKNTKCQR